MQYIFCFRVLNIISILLAMVIISINIFFVSEKLIQAELPIYGLSMICVLSVFYFALIAYFSFHLYIGLRGKSVDKGSMVEKYVMTPIKTSPSTTPWKKFAFSRYSAILTCVPFMVILVILLKINWKRLYTFNLEEKLFYICYSQSVNSVNIKYTFISWCIHWLKLLIESILPWLV